MLSQQTNKRSYEQFFQTPLPSEQGLITIIQVKRNTP